MLQNVIAGQLINGCYESVDALRANCEYLGFSLDSHLYLVCYVSILGEHDSETTASADMDKINAVKTTFKTMITKTPEGQVLYNEISLTDLVLIACFNDPEQINQFLESLAIASQKISDKYGSLFVMGISNPNKRPTDLTKSYQQAYEALNYVQLEKNERFIKYADIPVHKIDYYYPIELEQRLVNTICLGNTENLEEIIRSLIVENFQKRKLTNCSLKQLYNDLLSTCYYLEHKIPTADNLSGHLISSNISQFKNQNSFEQIFSVLRLYCDAVMSLKSDRNKIFIEKIIDYINKNYHDENLNLTSVSSKFNISSGYLSTFFKKQTGKNFSDYVEMIRINFACRLLKETDLTINDICLKVGFTNVKSFRRTFERIKGTNPKAARQELSASPDHVV